MAINRREFLTTTLATTAATVFGSKFSFAEKQHRAEHIGVQLYTVRDAMQQDMDGTLAKVAAIGYKEVELAGFTMDGGKILYFTHSPEDLKASLDRHGLAAISTHVNYVSLSPENFPKVIEVSKMLGHRYIVNPWIDDAVRTQPDGWNQAAATFNHAGEMSKKSGIQFAYHNHWFEWFPVNGKLPYDILLQETDPNLVKMEMDLCWITIAGQDPVKYFDRYPGRFPLVHVKDMKKLPKVNASGKQDFGDSLADMTEVGSGVIDWKRIFAHADKAGIKYYIVEHDKPESPFESIRTSYQYMKALRF
ncbi:MAG: sugar phosphate isomerase/epimerase family protein [Terriglobales bacterium]